MPSRVRATARKRLAWQNSASSTPVSAGQLRPVQPGPRLGQVAAVLERAQLARHRLEAEALALGVDHVQRLRAPRAPRPTSTARCRPAPPAAGPRRPRCPRAPAAPRAAPPPPTPSRARGSPPASATAWSKRARSWSSVRSSSQRAFSAADHAVHGQRPHALDQRGRTPAGRCRWRRSPAPATGPAAPPARRRRRTPARRTRARSGRTTRSRSPLGRTSENSRWWWSKSPAAGS